MNLAVSMYSYHAAVADGRLDIRGFIHEAKKAGVAGVELLDFYYKDVEADRAAAQEAIAETRLQVPIFSVANNFAKATAEEREEQLRKITFGVDEALVYGAKVVRVFAGDVASGIDFEAAFEYIVDGLTKASDYAFERGVKLALENHGTLAGRGEQVRTLIEAVRNRCGNDALGANPDTGNFLLVNQASHEAIAEVAPYAYMVHFKDFLSDENGAYTALDGSKYKGMCVGEGIVNLQLCIKHLKDAGYDGWLSVEYEGVEDPLTAVPRSLRNAREFL